MDELKSASLAIIALKGVASFMKICLTTAFIFIMVFSWGQKAVKYSGVYKDADTLFLNQFLNNNPPYFYVTDTDFYVNFCGEYQRKINEKRNKYTRLFEYLDSQNTRGFIWNDFNNDGKKDLIFGSCGKYGLNVSFWISNKNNYDLRTLFDSREEDSVLWYFKFLDKEKFLMTTKIKLDSSLLDKNDFSQMFIRDTLKFTNETFLDHDLDKGRNDLDTLKIKTSTWVRSYDFQSEIIFCRNNFVVINSNFLLSNHSIKGSFLYQGKLRPKSFRRFWYFANSVNFLKYTTNYGPIINEPNHLLVTELTFKNGFKKKISDLETSDSPEALKFMYDLLYSTIDKNKKRIKLIKKQSGSNEKLSL